MYTVVKFKKKDEPEREFSFAVIGDLDNILIDGIEETCRYSTETLPLEADILLDANKQVLVEFSTPHDGDYWRGRFYGSYRDSVHYTISVEPKNGTLILPSLKRDFEPGYKVEINGFTMDTDPETGAPMCATLPMREGIEYLGSESFEITDRKQVPSCEDHIKYIAVMWKGTYRFKAVDMIGDDHHTKYFSNANSAVQWLKENEPCRRYPDDYESKGECERKPKFDLAKVIWPVIEEYCIDDVCFVSDTVVYFTIGASKIRVTAYNNQKRVSGYGGRQEWKDVRMLEYAIVGNRYHDHIKLEFENMQMAIESLRRFVRVFY